MRYVVAVDGSEDGDRALERAVELADAVGGSLTVVHAVDPDVYTDSSPGPVLSRSEAERGLVVEAVADAEERAQRIVEEAAGRAAEAGVPVETELLYGDPREAVPRFAEEEGYDGVFVGHRGLSDREEELLGSVAKGIVERATVPVTVVR
jgi:nucleotide-binding universal stress UspA family protein